MEAPPERLALSGAFNQLILVSVLFFPFVLTVAPPSRLARDSINDQLIDDLRRDSP